MSKQKNIAILMADLTGYTAMTEIHGAESALAIVNKYLALAKQSMHGNARLLERVGDQLVIVSEDPYDIAVTATELVSRCAAEPEFLMIHAGIHFGPVLENEGSYFGTAMNLAARIAANAPRGKILCSKEFIDHLAAIHTVSFGSYAEFKLKNIMQPVLAAELITNELVNSSQMFIDPVCHMQVENPDLYQFTYNHTTYHFCSEQCREIFISNPF